MKCYRVKNRLIIVTVRFKNFKQTPTLLTNAKTGLFALKTAHVKICGKLLITRYFFRSRLPLQPSHVERTSANFAGQFSWIIHLIEETLSGINQERCDIIMEFWENSTARLLLLLFIFKVFFAYGEVLEYIYQFYFSVPL